MDPDDAARVRLIKQALINCKQEPSDDAVARQFYYETGRNLHANNEKARGRRRRSRTRGASSRYHQKRGAMV